MIVKLEKYGEKTWIEFDDKTGEEKKMSARTLELISNTGIPFRMFENGGLKVHADLLSDLMEKGSWFELEHEGFEEFTLDDGTPARVNKYGIFAAETPKEISAA